MARPKSGRSRQPAVFRRAADFSRQRLVQSAKNRLHSAKSLISTVLDDTGRVTRQVRPYLFLDRYSPVLASRASHRMQPRVQPLYKIVSDVSLPQRALACAKRQIRKEVLHALKLTGKGSGARYRRRDEDSFFKCKG